MQSVSRRSGVKLSTCSLFFRNSRHIISVVIKEKPLPRSATYKINAFLERFDNTSLVPFVPKVGAKMFLVRPTEVHRRHSDSPSSSNAINAIKK